jgi:hypothetical protein
MNKQSIITATLALAIAFTFNACSDGNNGRGNGTPYCVIDDTGICVAGLTGRQCREEGYQGHEGYFDTECPLGYDKTTVSSSSSGGSSSSGNGSSSPGGTVSLTVGATDGATYQITGIAEAENGNTITSIILASTGATIVPVIIYVAPSTISKEFSTFLTVNASSCAIAGASVTVTITATVAFSEGAAATTSKEFTHQCTGAASDLSKKSVTVGGNGSSVGPFVDLDPETPVIYTQTGATSYTSQIEKIDLVYAPAFTTGNLTRIYSADGVRKSTSDWMSGSTVKTNFNALSEATCGSGGYCASIMWKLTAAQKATAASATTWGALQLIIADYNMEADYDANLARSVQYVDAAVGEAFIVLTTNDNYRIVTVDVVNAKTTITITSMSQTP